MQVAQQAACTGKDALTVILQRHKLLHNLYESSLLTLVATTQSAALGIKSAMSDVMPLDWAALFSSASAARQEHVKDYEKECEPSDHVVLGMDVPPFDMWNGAPPTSCNSRCDPSPPLLPCSQCLFRHLLYTPAASGSAWCVICLQQRSLQQCYSSARFGRCMWHHSCLCRSMLYGVGLENCIGAIWMVLHTPVFAGRCYMVLALKTA
jgi:hypothetical protein